MKKKVVGIFVCMLLVSTVLPVTGNLDKKTMTSTGEIESIPVLEFKNISSGIITNLLGFSVELTNSGEGTTGNITWSMNVYGGLYDFPLIKKLFVPKWMTYGVIDPLGQDQSGTIKIGPPLLPLGRFNVSFNCTYTIYKITNLSGCDECEADVTVIQEYVDQGFIFWHTFPEDLQPVREWVNITEYTYIDGGCVLLNYSGPPIGVCQLHNVRVWNPDSVKTEFSGACSFTDGNATIKECHVTRGIVESGDAYWQVELVNNE